MVDHGSRAEPDTSDIQHRTLFDDAFEMTASAILVFAIADIRRLARQGQVPEHPLSLPISGDEFETIVREHGDVFKDNVRSNLYQTSQEILNYALAECPSMLTDASIHRLGDENAKEECVYSIVSNTKRKRITLAFRGSMTLQDWITDSKMMSSELRNPLVAAKDDDKDDDVDDQPRSLGVHLGFRNYLYANQQSAVPNLFKEGPEMISKAVPCTSTLFSENSERNKEGRDTKGKNIGDSNERCGSGENSSPPVSERLKEGTTALLNMAKGTSTAALVAKLTPSDHSGNNQNPPRNKIDCILDEVEEVLEKYPTFQLYITGHSLGGALSVLASLEAAARLGTKLAGPITNVAIANPRVGDERFRQAIHKLEEEGKLRCLLVHNRCDLGECGKNDIGLSARIIVRDGEFV